MTALITVNPKLPAHLAALLPANPASLQTALTEMTGGIHAGFPIISYKGKVWRVKSGGEEQVHADDDGNAMPYIDVVLIQANPLLSNIYYAKGYVEGSVEAPTCFSNDGVRPDASVQHPVASVCQGCPNKAWGSRITEQGKKARACQDARRMAVAFADDLNTNGLDAAKLLLRVPPASLQPLKEYCEKVLAPKGLPFFFVVTRIGFDIQSAYPQFTFKAVGLLNETQAAAVGSFRDSDEVKRILAEAQEFSAGTTAPAAAAGTNGNTGSAPVASAAPAATTVPAGKPATPAAKVRPATEEEAGLDSLFAEPAAQPAAKPKALKATASKPTASAQPAAAPAAAKAKPKAAPVPAVVEEEEEEAVTPDPGALPDNFDSMLQSILDG